jgi:hypothetical protein
MNQLLTQRRSELWDAAYFRERRIGFCENAVGWQAEEEAWSKIIRSESVASVSL